MPVGWVEERNPTWVIALNMKAHRVNVFTFWMSFFLAFWPERPKRKLTAAQRRRDIPDPEVELQGAPASVPLRLFPPREVRWAIVKTFDTL